MLETVRPGAEKSQEPNMVQAAAVCRQTADAASGQCQSLGGREVHPPMPLDHSKCYSAAQPSRALG